MSWPATVCLVVVVVELLQLQLQLQLMFSQAETRAQFAQRSVGAKGKEKEGEKLR